VVESVGSCEQSDNHPRDHVSVPVSVLLGRQEGNDRMDDIASDF
jgi:hypothetical protein